MQVQINDVPFSFPAVFHPQAYGDGNPAYGGKFAITPGSANHKAIVNAMLNEAKGKWGDKADVVLKILKDDKRVAYMEAPYSSKKDGSIYAGFEDKYTLSCRSESVRPSAFNRDGVTPILPDDNLIHSGVIVNAFVDIYAFDSPKWGRRINCTLTGIQYVAQGDSLGSSAPVAPGMFAPVPSDEDFV